jgi:hypothetical protein
MKSGETPTLTEARRIERAAEEKRLAAALRDNLKRRKEQARAKQASASPVPGNAADEPQG